MYIYIHIYMYILVAEYWPILAGASPSAHQVTIFKLSTSKWAAGPVAFRLVDSYGGFQSMGDPQ